MGFGAELVQWLDVLPAAVVVVLLAMSPVGEVRLAIPVAILYYHMDWAEAFTWALLGNLSVVPLLHWLYPAGERLLRRWGPLDRGIGRLYAKTRRKHSERMLRYEEFAIFLFVATPIPGTGAWSGVLVAHVFGVPFRAAARYYYAAIVAACFVTAGLVSAGVWGFDRI